MDKCIVLLDSCQVEQIIAMMADKVYSLESAIANYKRLHDEAEREVAALKQENAALRHMLGSIDRDAAESEGDEDDDE